MKKLNLLSLSVALSIGICSSAFANDTMDVMLNNTAHAIAKDGSASDWLFNNDGTLSTSSGDKGTWQMQSENLCAKMNNAEQDSCVTLPSGKTIGSTWDQVDFAGNTLQVTIVKGR